jgi:hypothetical protein
MRSVPAAMIWEIFGRGRWHLLSFTLGSIAFPALVLTALKRDGALDMDNPPTLILHTTFTLLGIMMCGAALLQSQGKIARLFSYPLSTPTLVAWRLFPAMAIITVQMAFINAVLNALFDLNWPIWGPALFAAAAFAAVAATLWLTENATVWIAVGMGVVSSFLGLWFKMRYGGFTSPPDHYWNYITPLEAITLLAISAASYWVAVRAVARLRCGEAPFSLGIIDRITRYLESFATFRFPSTTPFASQCRYEWRRKGWLMPAGVLMVAAGSVIGWFFTDRDPENLILMQLGIGSALSLMGIFGGMAFGNTGSDDAHYGMTSFLATRPISDSDLTRVILSTAAASVLLSWAIWAISFALVCLGLIAAGASQTVVQVAGISWVAYVAILLGPWTVTGIVASLGFFGRLGAILITLTAFCGCIIAFALLNTFISSEWRATLRQVVFVGGALMVLVITPWLFATAKRRRFITSSVVSASAAFWVIAVAFVMSFWPAVLPFTFTAIMLSLAAMALVVIPLAAAPLALSANRHR